MADCTGTSVHAMNIDRVLAWPATRRDGGAEDPDPLHYVEDPMQLPPTGVIPGYRGGQKRAPLWSNTNPYHDIDSK